MPRPVPQREDSVASQGAAVEPGSGLQPRQRQTPPPAVGDAGEWADLFGITDRGRVRPGNQDHFLLAELRRTLVMTHGNPASRSSRRVESVQSRLLVVADGMGGYEGGGIASSVAVDSLAAFVLEIVPWFSVSTPGLRKHLGETLRAGVRASDEAVYRSAIELDLDERMGTTLTAVYVTWPEAHVVHVGDSRAYLIRDEAISRLTTDHTVAQELLTARAIDVGQAARSQLRHVLVNTVGGQREKQLRVDLDYVELVPGDALLLCTDGVTAHVEEAELLSIVLAAGNAEEAARDVLGRVLARGAVDNVTVVVARFPDAGVGETMR